MWVNLGIGMCGGRIIEGLIWRGGDGVVVPESRDPFFFFFFFKLFIYLFIHGCVGSSFLCEGFL